MVKKEVKDESNEEEVTEVQQDKKENMSIETEDIQENTEGSSTDGHEDKHLEYEARLKEEEGKYLKLLAEFENFKRRNRQEIETHNKYKEQKFAEDLLPVIDNFERALQVEDTNNAHDSLKKGITMIHDSLINVLNNHQVTVIESVGETFDPNFHQAVMMEKNEAFESGIVTEELQKGYLLKDRVIRPSMVKVSE